MKLQHITLLSLVAAMLGLMTACSKKAELLDTVPASSAMVTTVDLKAICERSGLEFTAEGIKASPETSGKLDGNIKAALDKLAMLDAKGVADLSTIVVGQDTKEGAFLTFSITDFERFKLIVEDAVTWSDDADGMHCGSLNRIPVAANDHQVWMLMNTNGSATGIVKKLLEQADEMPVSKLEGIAQSLYRDNLINTAVVNGLDPFNAKSESDVPVPEKVWNVAALNTSADSKSIVLEWEQMASTGEMQKFKGLKNINPAVLAYVPEGFTVTFGAGLTNDFDWKPIETVITMLGGFQAGAFMAVVKPYLESIDGTVLIAARPSDPDNLDSNDPSDWDFILLAHMPQDKINQLTSTVSSMMSTAGITPKAAGEGLISVPQYGKEMTIGNVDGYLGISTIGFDNTRNNSLAPIFVNKDMAFNFTANPLSDYLDEAPEGVALEVSLGMTDSKGQAKFALPGSGRPILEYLLSLLLQEG